jgi:glycosyltransferase involved in cell wall biosynthesis
MIAYHYPPEGSSSGVHRTLAFSRDLPARGWSPVVLTVSPRAYPVARRDQLDEIPRGVAVRRTAALDSGRHLAVGGRYLWFTALPDRWVSWWPTAVIAGLGILRKYRPQVVWSTYPIATAHLIGWTLQKLSGLPWVADFRDSMTEEGYPYDERQRRAYRWIERRTMERCSKAVFTAPGALEMYAGRYPSVPRRRLAVIANGYEEESFASVEGSKPEGGRSHGEEVVLLHSGVLYPSERDPSCFYRAIAALRREGRLAPGAFRVVLRATGHDEHHRRLIDECGIQDVVTLSPGIPYRQALREMMDADGLLVFQAASCNHQIPAKIYEYVRARRPILALTDPRGDTATTLAAMGFGAIVPLDDEGRIKEGLLDFVSSIRDRRARIATEEVVRGQSRTARSAELARVLDEVADSAGPA